MAFLDDPAMIIAHIRHSCVTGDETGLCEMVIVDEEKNEEQTFYQGRKRSVTGDLIDRFDERPYSQSLEISVTPSRRLHQRSERRDGRRQGPQVKTIKLQTDGNKKPELTESEVTGLFQPAEIPPRSNVPVVSMLALQLEEDGMSTDNMMEKYT
ncbi:target of rapamycin complex 2 subunit MAPKAP1-like [Corticium candelabrum]|uniref:target of rapamycin complex 2 subunit MAPKAP1-like n=1 Tax=Corticium candelabrum TaxID=121492 RepID=UPI002E2679CA|nr:target of rapamycin complex 2 subunit MAPKAP1-like [Corticium candelabrum]